MNDKRYPKIGIALGSGGAQGLSHIGVLKTLQAHGIPISHIAGSSIGALVGAYYSAYPDLSKLEELIFNINKRKGFLLFDPTFRGGLIKGKRIETFISDMLGEANFNTLRIPFAAIATDFYTAEEVIITKGDLTKAVRASISVPGVFQPFEYENRLLADGGLSDPVPTQVAKDMDSEIVIGVNVESSYFYEPIEKIPTWSKIPMHSVNILRHNLTFQSLKSADIVISPKLPPTGLIGWNYFYDTEKAKQIIKAGEIATLDKLPELLYLISKKRKKSFDVKKYFTFFKKYLPPKNS